MTIFQGKFGKIREELGTNTGRLGGCRPLGGGLPAPPEPPPVFRGGLSAPGRAGANASGANASGANASGVNASGVNASGVNASGVNAWRKRV